MTMALNGAIELSSAGGLLATSPCADKGCRAWYPPQLGSSCIFVRRCDIDIHTKAESSTFWGTMGKGHSRLSSLSQQRCHLSTLILICLSAQNGLSEKNVPREHYGLPSKFRLQAVLWHLLQPATLWDAQDPWATPGRFFIANNSGIPWRERLV